jgi:hypothetical protein
MDIQAFLGIPVFGVALVLTVRFLIETLRHFDFILFLFSLVSIALACGGLYTCIQQLDGK